MTDVLKDLYQQVIVDHSRKPRNFRVIADARKVEGHNPLCGDHLDMYVKMDGDRIADISFEGSGCAISTASASLLTESIKGKTIEEAEALFEAFHELVTGVKPRPEERRMLGKLEAFSGVCDYPTRVKCATLAWHTLRAALRDGKHEKVSTE